MRRGKREEKLYLEVGDGVSDGEPGSPGVLLVAKWAIKSLGDGAEVEGADSRSCNAVSERQEVVGYCPSCGHWCLEPHWWPSRHDVAPLRGLPRT